MNRAGRFLLFLAVIFGGPLHPQDKADSLKKLIATEPNDSVRAAHIILIASQYLRTTQYDSALAWGRLGLAQAQGLNNKHLISAAYANLGVTCYYRGDHQNALSNFLGSLKIEEALGRKARAAKMYNNIGAIYVDKAFFAPAETNYQKGNALYEELGDTLGLMQSSVNLGNLYGVKSQEEKDPLVARASLVKAIEYNSRAFRYACLLGDSVSIANSLANLGQNYMYLHDYRQAYKKLQEAVALVRRLHHPYDLAISLLQLGDVQSRTENYNAALKSFTEALQIGTRLDNPDILKFAYLNLAGNYSLVGDYETAFRMHKLYVNVKDSLFTTESTRQLHALQVAFDTEKKEKENALLQEKNNSASKTIRQQRLIGITIGVVCVLLIGFAVMIFRANKEKARINLQLERKNELIERQKTLVEVKQKEILDSIYYARRIQRTLLSSEKYIYRQMQRLQK